MKTKRIDFRQLCEAPFDMDSEYDVNFRMLVYTGEKREEKPVFRTVIAKGECKVSLGNPAKEFWGIIGFDQKTGENQWYNYNDCVSLDGWGVLDRLLRSRFGWMATVDPAIAEEVKARAKAQFAEEGGAL